MPAKTIHGVGASPGIAIGQVQRYASRTFAAEQQHSEDPEGELARLKAALEEAQQEIHALYLQAQTSVGSQEAQIFEAHEMFLSDPDLLQHVTAGIQEKHQQAAYAWQEGIQLYATQLRAIGNEYLAARALDLDDVGQRVLRLLQGEKEQTTTFRERAVIVAHDLTPSETVGFDSQKVCAFCIAVGGPTSHVAILAKALGIPAITGLGSAIEQLEDGAQVIVDGSAGELLSEPDAETLAHYEVRVREQEQKQQDASQMAQQPAQTLDGTKIKVMANLSAPEQVEEALAQGAEGVGLLRTEILFMERTIAPSEEEQFSVYRGIFEKLGSRPMVVRTFDIGGDKPAAYLEIAPETNPFLGVRGIRLALKRPELLQTQLRALLRAGEGHALKIMFPMITSSEEVQAVREQVDEARKTLEARGIVVASQIELGIMVEVPAAAVMADVLATRIDFFSIGTNDLAQYTLAADRTNSEVAALADALHPAVLRLIRQVIEAAHAYGKWVGLCGELAGDPLATPVLLGLGLDEFSMSAPAVPVIKQQIRRYSLEEAQAIARQALSLANAMEVRTYLATVAR